MEFVIETSARHVHVTRETLDILFGKGFELEVKKDLSQPGQYVSNQKVDVVGPRSFTKCSILGPVRPVNQVELTFTEARALGIVAPVRESGDVAGSAPCKIVGPCGEVEISEGVIIAKRHVHMTPADAEAFGVTNGQIVSVEVQQETGRKIVFGDTVVRVSPKAGLAMHIDTDESNAGCCSGVITGKIVK
ncbi:MAG: phosphate propanoyltransferase [Bacteroidales bacterium]|nr:phosphate propanoyltransferase [Bacteroidales bacterium]